MGYDYIPLWYYVYTTILKSTDLPSNLKKVFNHIELEIISCWSHRINSHVECVSKAIDHLLKSNANKMEELYIKKCFMYMA
jgi:hypothetical protein